jgi:hypothetical protein
LNENKNCRKYAKTLPSFTPVINNLSVNTSIVGNYSLVYITGQNFLPNGFTYVNFNSDTVSYKNIAVTYYDSFTISFVVPSIATAGTYNITVVNIYNGQLAQKVKYSYIPNLNYSNSEQYVVTNAVTDYISIASNYTQTSNQYYGHIYTITGNTTLTVNAAITLQFISVGGGGGGGCGASSNGNTSGGGGGGGGGGETLQSSVSLNPGSYTVVIGNGGIGGIGDYYSPTNGTNGGASYLSFNGNNSLQASGGTFGINGTNYDDGGIGGTGGYSQNTPGSAGGDQGADGSIGGGGGGGAYNTLYYQIGNGATNISITYYDNTLFAGFGGGGGAGGGADFQYGTSCGSGGYGGTINGGGSAGSFETGTPTPGTDGQTNYGGGGGGGGAGDDFQLYIGGNGGNGGSGVIILYF